MCPDFKAAPDDSCLEPQLGRRGGE
ncbi:hypothetical protein EYZ11_010836 [Aspergillus tanneri]|uniref:Uncharacterized protein n=1 Tax=Aspergillus tanneri TaxID=1220188 RepID=A0A4S3J4E4_9EURO|nr:hypothetical protein EYZ11_010836 [Aspergillus tanneri]